MFNPLLSLQMAWADNKLTNSFWCIIHDLFSFSGKTFFLREKKKNRPKHIPKQEKNRQFDFQSIIAKYLRIQNV